MDKQTKSEKIAVIGAGIIGAAIAYELQKRGKSVTLIDRDEPGKGASYGNMASIAVTEFLPTARPSILSKIPKWLIDPQGPVCLRPSYLPKATPWLLKFLKAATPQKVEALSAAGALLCHRALNDMFAMLSSINAKDMISEQGCICLYANDKEFENDRDHIETLNKYGFAYQKLSAKEVNECEPAITDKIGFGLLFPDNRSISSPYLLVEKLVNRFHSLNGVIIKGSAVDFVREAGGGQNSPVRAVILDDGRQIAADEFVICAGAYSGYLAKKMHEPIPLETERGYHTQIMQPDITLKHSIIWPEKAFMVTPTAGGIRVGGTVEMAGLYAAPNYKRSQITVARAKEALPDLKEVATSQWMGHRPALPDTIPIISRSQKAQNTYYATGHGHLGLTYSATTAQLIANLIMGMDNSIDLSPFRINRF